MKDINLVEGEVVENLPNTTFKVKLEGKDNKILCHLSGKMRINRIKVIPGDKVKVAMSPYDANRGRIVYRVK
jgi:translation initiation factor IF-1